MMLVGSAFFFLSLVGHMIEGFDYRYSSIMMLMFAILAMLFRIIDMLERRDR